MIYNFKAFILKIDLLVFTQNLFKYKNLANNNFISILIKVESVIKINNINNYKKTNIII